MIYSLRSLNRCWSSVISASSILLNFLEKSLEYLLIMLLISSNTLQQSQKFWAKAEFIELSIYNWCYSYSIIKLLFSILTPPQFLILSLSAASLFIIKLISIHVINLIKMKNTVNLQEIYISPTLFHSATPSNLHSTTSHTRIEASTKKDNQSIDKSLPPQIIASKTDLLGSSSKKESGVNTQSQEVAHQPKIIRSNNLKKSIGGNGQYSRHNSNVKTERVEREKSSTDELRKLKTGLNGQKNNLISKLDNHQRVSNYNTYRFQTEQLIHHSNRNKSLQFSYEHQKGKLADLIIQNQSLSQKLHQLALLKQNKQKNIIIRDKQIQKLKNRLQVAQETIRVQEQEEEREQEELRKMEGKRSEHYRRMIEQADTEYEKYCREFRELQWRSVDEEMLVKENERLSQKIQSLQVKLEQMRAKNQKKKKSHWMWDQKQREFNDILAMIAQAKQI